MKTITTTDRRFRGYLLEGEVSQDAFREFFEGWQVKPPYKRFTTLRRSVIVVSAQINPRTHENTSENNTRLLDETWNRRVGGWALDVVLKGYQFSSPQEKELVEEWMREEYLTDCVRYCEVGDDSVKTVLAQLVEKASSVCAERAAESEKQRLKNIEDAKIPEWNFYSE